MRSSLVQLPLLQGHGGRRRRMNAGINVQVDWFGSRHTLHHTAKHLMLRHMMEYLGWVASRNPTVVPWLVLLLLLRSMRIVLLFRMSRRSIVMSTCIRRISTCCCCCCYPIFSRSANNKTVTVTTGHLAYGRRNLNTSFPPTWVLSWRSIHTRMFYHSAGVLTTSRCYCCSAVQCSCSSTNSSFHTRKEQKTKSTREMTGNDTHSSVVH